MPVTTSYSQWPREATGDQEQTIHKKEEESLPTKQPATIDPAVADNRSESPDTVHEDESRTRLSAESRMELIARIKKDLRPQWLQDTGAAGAASEAEQPGTTTGAGLLPPLEIDEAHRSDFPPWSRYEPDASFQKPKSALHRGDFNPNPSASGSTWMSTSPTTPWYTHALSQQDRASTRADSSQVSAPLAIQTRARAASNTSLSSSFVFRQPTSPLTVSSHIDDIAPSQARQTSPDKHRRRTFSPSFSWNAIQPGIITSPVDTPSFSRENTFPRRSLSSFQHSHSFSGAITSSSRPRRPSFSPDISPIQHAPLVGRYEESILRGRMSTNPSKPVDFVAQIGVLGRGACKPSLKCPPHVTVPFPAVFYHYNSDRPSPIADGPSPYVGLVDLENNLRSPSRVRKSRVRTSRSPSANRPGSQHDEQTATLKGRRGKAKSNADTPHHRPPKGSYRIPEQGQLQIVIKNPNKNAVKLFLVPYDLTGMPPGTKTFVRQRAFSAGPIVDMPLSAAGSQPVASISNAEDPRDRPVLRYLIHLHICSPSRGRFYLYKSIRVVFANRVPDDKEKLRNEVTLPDPLYTTWKPAKENKPGEGLTNTVGTSPVDIEMSDPISPSSIRSERQYKPPKLLSFSRTPLPAILSRTTSFEPHTIPTMEPMALDDHQVFNGNDGEVSPKSGSRSSTSTHSSPQPIAKPLPGSSAGPSRHGTADRPTREGLIALQLRDWASRSRSGTPDGSG